MATDDALAIGQEALKGVASVAARDASLFVPVQAAEISRVLGKRLFEYIDQEAARNTAEEYERLYSRNRSLLPDQAIRTEYVEQMVAHYPFHPTLIDFLNHKLAAAVVERDDSTGVDLTIENPLEDCLIIKELKKRSQV